MLEVGMKAPDFSLKANDGKAYSLKDFQGKKLVLYFYPKDDTPGCTKEACAFTESIEDFEKKDSVVVGVSVDDLESHEKFIKKYSLKTLLLSDPEKKTVQDYGVWKEKSMYGKSYYGIERTTFVIDGKGMITKIYSKVNPDGHSNTVLAEL
ncbi:Peroxiredoxin [uncultured archaeon]|nr:Peroxiredoxin [uncultured archaeon]